MYESLTKITQKSKPPKQTTLTYGPWIGGLLTERRAEQAQTTECSEILNFVLTEGGIARTRDGSTLVSSGCTGDVKAVGDVLVSGTWYTIMTDSDDKVYRDNAGTATAIGTLEGETRFCGFMGLLLLFDGSYIKAWDGTDLYILYDSGTGSSRPYQFTNRAGTEDSNLALGNGTNTRVAYKFTSQSWDSGYTIPPTTIFARLSKEGNGYTGTDNVPITARIRKVSNDDIMAAKTLVATAGELSGSSVEYDVTFTDSDITTELSPSVAYYASLEYNNGDATNYVKVHCTDVASGGLGFHYAGSWSADTDKDPILGLKPGRPPKAVFGLVHDNRLFCIEGESGTNPSYLWYSASGNHLDWSTADGGGYVAAIDDSATNYPIGGVASWYGGLWIFGSQRQPFLGQLSGSTPSSYAITATLQRVSGHYRNIVATPDDVFFLTPAGVDAISTIQEYGDIKASTQTDNIRRTIHRYFSTAAFAEYDPEWGIYLLKLESYDRVIAVHTRLKALRFQGVKQEVYAPVTEWEFAFSDSPTAFGRGNGYLLVGTDAGKVYKMDNSEVQDNDIDATYQIKTSYQLTRSGELAANRVSQNIFSKFGAAFNLVFYRNHDRESYHSEPVILPWDNSTTPEELTMDPAEMTFILNPEAYFDRTDVNFNFRSLMLGIEDVQLNGWPVYVGDIILLADKIGGF